MAELGVISAVELAQRLKAGDDLVVLDVREPGEIELAPFPGAYWIAMGDIPARIAELDPDRETVVVCHHGVRSAQVAGYLYQAGFAQVLNLAGGIEAWAVEVDSSVPRY